MEDLIQQLSKYDFFRNKNLKIYNIQDYGRQSKFKILLDNNYYTLIMEKERIIPYIKKMNVLGNKFKEIIGFKYLSHDNKILVLDYFGNDNGIDLIKLENSNLTLKEQDYSCKLKEIIENIHSNKLNYVDFSSNNYLSWKEYYLDEISEKIYSIYNQKFIDDITFNTLMYKLKESAKRYNEFDTTLIHADITPLNVCIDISNQNLYLIDYDDFKIGDPLMDISRIINCKNMSNTFKKIVDKYYSAYENNLNHLFYTLRVNINWYNQIIKKHQEDIYDLPLAKKEVYDVIKDIVDFEL